MRRTDREVKSFDEIIGILEKCKVLHLAMISDGKPYSVPVNFGYIMNEENGCKKLGLDALMNHAGYKLPAGEDSIFYKDEHFQMTTVAKIEVEEITGKIRGR